MARYKKYTKYTEEQKEVLLNYVSELSEKDRRLFLAVQYKQLGFGSQRYIAEVFGCSRITITRGCKELEQKPEQVDNGRQRQEGGGRKKKTK